MANKRKKHIKDPDMEWIMSALFVLLIVSILTLSERGMQMYRPPVSYDEAFRTYVDALFHATHLERKQIMKGALYLFMTGNSLTLEPK
jgi:hypothetical protein